jgi:hypothetical protein
MHLFVDDHFVNVDTLPPGAVTQGFLRGVNQALP